MPWRARGPMISVLALALCACGPAAPGGDSGTVDASGRDVGPEVDAGTDDGGADDDSGADGGTVCTLGRCAVSCEEAAAAHSYFGCEFLPVATLNNTLRITDAGGASTREAFHFAIVVVNPGPDTASVRTELHGSTVTTRSVMPGSVVTILLDWNDALQPIPDTTTGLAASALALDAAYRVTSDQPVAVYQFNPLEALVAGSLPLTVGTEVSSFSNDASLLLPTHAMTGDYVVISRPTHQLHQVVVSDTGTDDRDAVTISPGFFTLVAAEAVTVEVTFTAHVLASADGVVRAYAPGERGTFTLAARDVLQVAAAAPPSCTPTGDADHSMASTGSGTAYLTVEYCAVGAEYDLTGTLVHATGRVELLGGHNCAFVPANRWACDHLEESIPPLVTWGTETIVSRTAPSRAEPTVVRIVSGADANTLQFDPAMVHEDVTLALGEFLELEATSAFRVTGSGPLQVADFLVGQDYAGFGSGTSAEGGDPSMSLLAPVAQFRSSYAFAVPVGYATEARVIAAPGTTVSLDGAPVALSTGGFPLSSGYHLAEGSAPFGLTVYGFAPYTSYMLPAGMDLAPLR